MADANFRLRCKDRGLSDAPLTNGLTYYVKDEPYNAWLAKAGNQVEVSPALPLIYS